MTVPRKKITRRLFPWVIGFLMDYHRRYCPGDHSLYAISTNYWKNIWSVTFIPVHWTEQLTMNHCPPLEYICLDRGQFKKLMTRYKKSVYTSRYIAEKIYNICGILTGYLDICKYPFYWSATCGRITYYRKILSVQRSSSRLLTNRSVTGTSEYSLSHITVTDTKLGVIVPSRLTCEFHRAMHRWNFLCLFIRVF